MHTQKTSSQEKHKRGGSTSRQLVRGYRIFLALIVIGAIFLTCSTSDYEPRFTGLVINAVTEERLDSVYAWSSDWGPYSGEQPLSEYSIDYYYGEALGDPTDTTGAWSVQMAFPNATCRARISGPSQIGQFWFRFERQGYEPFDTTYPGDVLEQGRIADDLFELPAIKLQPDSTGMGKVH